MPHLFRAPGRPGGVTAEPDAVFRTRAADEWTERPLTARVPVGEIRSVPEARFRPGPAGMPRNFPAMSRKAGAVASTRNVVRQAGTAYDMALRHRPAGDVTDQEVPRP